MIKISKSYSSVYTDVGIDYDFIIPYKKSTINMWIDVFNASGGSPQTPTGNTLFKCILQQKTYGLENLFDVVSRPAQLYEYDIGDSIVAIPYNDDSYFTNVDVYAGMIKFLLVGDGVPIRWSTIPFNISFVFSISSFV